MAAEHVLLRLSNAPGDTAVLTALVRDIALTMPDRFRVSVATHAMSLWRDNPYVIPPAPGVRVLNMRYKDHMRKGHRSAGERPHFLRAFHDIFAEQTGVSVPLQLPRPDLYIPAETERLTGESPYWVIFPGCKADMPTKEWDCDFWQQTIDALAEFGIRCVQVGCTAPGHRNPTLDRVERLVGQTTVHQLLRLIRDAEGVVCGITFGMHIAAAFERPCVVLAGGREAWWWEAYTNENPGFGAVATGKVRVPHRFLHSIGSLECCKNTGCGRPRIYQTKDIKADRVCTQLTSRFGRMRPRCMDMIRPTAVRDAVLSYYDDGTLVPYTKALSLRHHAPPLPQPDLRQCVNAT